MGCEKATVKFLLFLFNFLFLLSGITLTVFGGLMLSQVDDGSIGWFSIFLVVVGSIIAVISFFGCCGAVIENHCMLMTFAFFLGCIFLVEVASGILILVYRDKIDTVVHDEFVDMWKAYDRERNPAASAVVDGYQETLQCCGVDSYFDWIKYHGQINLPESCCKDRSLCQGGVAVAAAQDLVNQAGKLFGVSSADLKKAENVYTEGCYKKLSQMWKKSSLTVGIIFLSICVIGLIGMFLACFLASASSRDKRLRNFV